MKKNKIERQLQQALDDATQEGLTIAEQKLVQTRVVALTKLFEYSLTTERLTAEIRRLTAELDRVKEENRLLIERVPASPKPIESLERIKRTLESAEAMRRTKQ
jgi:hypothetical protein